MVKLTELDNGNLQISITDKEDFKRLLKREFRDERHYLIEMLDSGGYLGNGWDALFNIGLTEAPAIGYGFGYDDDGRIIEVENLWYFGDYMVKSYLKILKKTGNIIFTLNR